MISLSVVLWKVVPKLTLNRFFFLKNCFSVGGVNTPAGSKWSMTETSFGKNITVRPPHNNSPPFYEKKIFFEIKICFVAPPPPPHFGNAKQSDNFTRNATLMHIYSNLVTLTVKFLGKTTHLQKLLNLCDLHLESWEIVPWSFIYVGLGKQD